MWSKRLLTLVGFGQAACLGVFAVQKVWRVTGDRWGKIVKRKKKGRGSENVETAIDGALKGGFLNLRTRGALLREARLTEQDSSLPSRVRRRWAAFASADERTVPWLIS